MIKLDLTLTDIAFEQLAERFLPELIAQLKVTGNPLAMLLSGSRDAAIAVLRRLPTETKEKLAVNLLNSRRQVLAGDIPRGVRIRSGRIPQSRGKVMLEKAAAAQGVALRIADANARLIGKG